MPVTFAALVHNLALHRFSLLQQLVNSDAKLVDEVQSQRAKICIVALILELLVYVDDLRAGVQERGRNLV